MNNGSKYWIFFLLLYIFLFLVHGKVLPTVEKYTPYEERLVNSVAWLKEGFVFPDKVTDRDTVKTGGL